MSNLTNKAMLATLKFSMWTPSKVDKDATSKLNTDNNTDAATVRKVLVSKDVTGPVTRAKGNLYTYYRENTLPWLDNGSRILPSALFTDFTDKMNTLTNEFNSAVNDFATNWNNIVANTPQVLGGLHNAADYPTEQEIRDSYEVSCDYMPIPVSDDFRSDISDDQAKMIKAEITKSLEQAAKLAQDDVFKRVSKAVGHMATSLENFKPKSKTTKQVNGFHDTLVSNISDLASILPALNLSDDPTLTKITDDIKAQLISHSASDLKTDTTKRKDTAAKAKAISAALDDLI